jgi:hypothetical protein
MAPPASLLERCRSFLSDHQIGSISVLLGFLTTAMLWIRYWTALHRPIYLTGDAASDGIMVSLAKHLRLDHGHYSQFAFFHPGAAMFYVEALGQWIFYNCLHLFPNENNAQWATLMLVNAAFIAGSAFCLGVVFRSARVVFATGFGILLYAAWPSKIFIQSGPSLLTQIWVPTQTIWCFSFFLCALIYVTTKKPSVDVVVAIATVLLAQRYLGLVPIAAIAMAGAFTYMWRTGRATRGRELRNGLIASSVLCIPNLLGLAFDWPWQLRNYARASVHQTRDPRGILQTFRFVASFWGIHHAWLFALVLLAAVGLSFWLWRRPASVTRNGYLALLVTLLASTVVALGVAYLVDSSISDLDAYQLSFYDGTVALAYATAAIFLLRWITAYLAVPAVLAFGSFGPSPQPNPEIPQALRAVVAAAHGRPIEYVSQGDAASWPTIAGLLLEDVRAGVKACAKQYDPEDLFLYSPGEVCSASSPTGRVRFVVNPTKAIFGATPIFTGSQISIVEPKGP